MDNKRKNPSILETNIFYLVLGTLLIFLGGFVQSREIYSGLLITQYLIILLPTISYLKIRGYSLKNTLKLNKISIKQIVLIPLIVIFAYPVGAFLNYIFILFLSNFIKIRPAPIPIPSSSPEFILGLIVISLSPGICEEILFRGMVMSSYDKLGKKKAIIISSVLFGVYHFNLQNLLGPIFLGAIFGSIVYKTKSIYSSMIAHGFNNAIALTIGYFLLGKMDKIQIQSEAIDISANSFATILSIIVGLIFSIVCASISYSLYKALPESKEEIEEELIEDYNFRKLDYIPLVGVLIIFIFYNYMFLFNQ